MFYTFILWPRVDRVSNMTHETRFSHGGGQMLPEGQVEYAMPLRVSTLNWHKDTPIHMSLAKASPKAKFKINRMGKYTLPMKARERSKYFLNNNIIYYTICARGPQDHPLIW